TPFGALPRPAGVAGDLRLVLLPGEVRATAAGDGPAGKVLATTPDGAAFRVRVALGDQIVQAAAATPLQPGDTTRLALTVSPRLLPWQISSPAPSIRP
ncbi:MAG: hypothetical protein ACK5BN_05855, partial [Planctomycetota bacterium]